MPMDFKNSPYTMYNFSKKQLIHQPLNYDLHIDFKCKDIIFKRISKYFTYFFIK